MGKIHPTTSKISNLRWSDLLDSQKQAGVLVQNLACSHYSFFHQKETRNHAQSSAKPSNRKYTNDTMMSVFFSAFSGLHCSQLTQEDLESMNVGF